MTSDMTDKKLIEEKCVPLSVEVLEYAAEGMVTATDLGVYVALQLNCDSSTGTYHGTASRIAETFFGDAILTNQVKKSLARMRCNGLINYKPGTGARSRYEILIHNFPVRTGPHTGLYLNAWDPNSLTSLKYDAQIVDLKDIARLRRSRDRREGSAE